LDTRVIDQDLAIAKDRGMAVKLRVEAGIHAPAWLKAETGPEITVGDPSSNIQGTVGRYWTPTYGQAYDHLQAMLAARYDSAPQLRQVEITRCSTVFAETFIRNVRNQTETQQLLAAGLTQTIDEQCIRDEIQAHQVWKLTRSGLAVNPYQAVQPGGHTRPDEAVTYQMMLYCRQVLGPRCVLENNSLRSPPLSGYATMYQQMSQLGGPIGFQTAALKRAGNMSATLNLAAQLGAGSVELPTGYQPTPQDQPQVAAMKANTSHASGAV
jgi:hypothetical protein